MLKRGDIVRLSLNPKGGWQLDQIPAAQAALTSIDPEDGSPSWWAPFTLAVVPDIRLTEGVIVIDRPPEIEAKPPSPSGEGGRA